MRARGVSGELRTKQEVGAARTSSFCILADIHFTSVRARATSADTTAATFSCSAAIRSTSAAAASIVSAAAAPARAASVETARASARWLVRYSRSEALALRSS